MAKTTKDMTITCWMFGRFLHWKAIFFLGAPLWYFVREVYFFFETHKSFVGDGVLRHPQKSPFFRKI